jgi:hypothetical protein
MSLDNRSTWTKLRYALSFVSPECGLPVEVDMKTEAGEENLSARKLFETRHIERCIYNGKVACGTPGGQAGVSNITTFKTFSTVVTVTVCMEEAMSVIVVVPDATIRVMYAVTVGEGFVAAMVAVTV